MVAQVVPRHRITPNLFRMLDLHGVLEGPLVAGLGKYHVERYDKLVKSFKHEPVCVVSRTLPCPAAGKPWTYMRVFDGRAAMTKWAKERCDDGGYSVPCPPMPDNWLRRATDLVTLAHAMASPEVGHARA